MLNLLLTIIKTACSSLKSQRQLAPENLAIRQQLVEAFPFGTAPRYLLRDRDGIYGETVGRRIKSLGIEDVATAPRSPWQNPYAGRVIGSMRRDCLDHVIVMNERHLRRIFREYASYYHTYRTHLSLNKDPTEHRPIERPDAGESLNCHRLVVYIIVVFESRHECRIF